MSDSQRSWIGVKGWLDKSSQIGKRFVPRRNSKRDSSTFEPKQVSELPAERLRNKEIPPQPPPSAAPSSRNGQRRMSTSSKQYATGYSETQYSDEKRRYSQSRRTGPPSSVSTEGYPKPRISMRHSDQPSYTTQSASIRLDDVDRRLSRRRSNTGELQNRKVLSDRRDSRASNIYSEEITRRARGGEPIRAQYPDSAPASRGRPTAGPVGDVVEVSKTDKNINDTRDDDLDVGNHLDPPRSSMSKRSSGVPDGFSQSRRLLKRRDSRASEHDELASHMRQLKLSEDSEKGRTRDRSRSRSIRELIRSRRDDAGTDLHNEKSRGRSLSRGSRFSSPSRSVDRRARRQDPDTERRTQETIKRRDSVLVQSSVAGKERHPVIVTQNGSAIRGESEGDPNLQRTKSRSPSKNSAHSRRRLSCSPSRASLRSQTRDIPVPRHDSVNRRPSDASDHVISGRTRVPSIISRSLPVGLGAPGGISHSSSRHVAEQEARHMEEEQEARRRRRSSTASSIENPRISPTDPRSGTTRGILRRTGRISSFADGPPPKPPPAASTNADPSRTRRASRSRSGSRSRAGKSDEEEHELRNNTIHNARNLKYQPHKDGYPSSSTSPSGRRGLVPLRYPPSDGSGRHLPLRRYTTSSVGAMPQLAMPRRPSYPVEHPLAVPSGIGSEMWYQGWPPNGIPITHDPYADPYGYGVHPSQISPSHAQYPSWPPGAYPQRRADGGAFMRPGSRA